MSRSQTHTISISCAQFNLTINSITVHTYHRVLESENFLISTACLYDAEPGGSRFTKVNLDCGRFNIDVVTYKNFLLEAGDAYPKARKILEHATAKFKARSFHPLYKDVKMHI